MHHEQILIGLRTFYFFIFLRKILNSLFFLEDIRIERVAWLPWIGVLKLDWVLKFQLPSLMALYTIVFGSLSYIDNCSLVKARFPCSTELEFQIKSNFFRICTECSNFIGICLYMCNWLWKQVCWFPFFLIVNKNLEETSSSCFVIYIYTYIIIFWIDK